MKNRYRILLIVLLLIGCLNANSFGQKMTVPDRPLEELFLTTDREVYITGEQIWFAVHSISSNGNEIAQLSKILYIELYDADEKIIRRGKLKFEDGVSSGFLSIPAEQTSGVYFLRAYTHYLMNFHPVTFPIKVITIINPSIPLSKSLIPPALTLKYTTRGGKLIAGLQAQIAFVIPQGLLESSISIDLHNQDTVIASKIPFSENGLGYVEFTPEINEKYFFQIDLSSGDSILTELPEVNKTGFVMRLDEAGKEVVYYMKRNQKNPFSENRKYLLRISSDRFSNLYYDSLSAVSPVTEFRIKKSILSPGINYFVLRNDKGELLDLSLYYHNPKQNLQVSITSSGDYFKTSERINVQFELEEASEEQIANISVSVTKKGTNNNISDLLPLRLIDNPQLIHPEIFTEAGANQYLYAQITLALLLYEGELAKNNNLIKELCDDRKMLTSIPETRNVGISGYVKNKNTGEAIPNSKVLLSYVGTHTQIHISETQENGYFIFPIDPYGPSQDLLLCTFDDNPDQEILINNDYSSSFARLNNIPLDLDTLDKRLIEEMYINQQIMHLREEDFPAIPKPKNQYELGFGSPNITIQLDDYIDLPSMDVVLNEIVPYVKVRKKKGNYRLTILDSETGLSYENHLILVDNIPLDNLNELMQIPPAAVEQIDVINRTYVIGDHTFQGIMIVTTYTENFGGITMPMDAVFIKYPLLTDEYSFPNYTLESQPNSFNGKANFRNVLYWNPQLTIKGKTEISFYSSDHHSTYEIIVRGITNEGILIFGRKEIVIGE